MPDRLTKFWQELKRRNVVRVTTVYAGAAFVIIELINNITGPLKLPEWTPTFVIVLLAIGFPIVIIFSWIYDIHPEGGVVKTTSTDKVKPEERPTSSNSWKIASYISFVVIVGLILLNIFGGNRRARIDESLEKSIAVLPFQKFSTDPDQEAMCLGLTDEIINHLYKIESFDKVSSLTSVLKYRNPERNVSEIAEDLGVNYILVGVYKKIGDQLSVSAELIEPKHDKHIIWQNEYVRSYEEIIAIQSDIALQIAEHLKTFLNESERENIQKSPTTSQEAYELLQTGLYLTRTRGAELHSQVLDLALEAIKLDPDYAEAYALAGRGALWNGIYFGETDIQSAAMDALPFFEKALELDQNNATAHFGMAAINGLARWDYVRAEKEYQRAIDLEPNNSDLYDVWLELPLKMNQLKKLFTYVDKVQGYRNGFFAIVGGYILLDNRKKAYELLAQASSDEMALPLIGEKYIWLEEYDSAKSYLESALQSEHYEMNLPRWQAALALVYHKTKDHNRTQAYIDRLIRKSDTTSAGSPAYFTGWYYSSIGEVDSAFYWLEKAYNNHSPELPWLKADPAFTNLKDDDRYWDLYERTGFKAFDDYIAGKGE